MYLLIIYRVKILVTGKYTVLIVSFSLLCVGLCFSSTIVLAEVIGTPGYNLSQPTTFPEPAYATIITGYVIDEDGNGVTNAVVTLWQNGKPWEFSGKIQYNSGTNNPQSSSILNPGSFTFGEVATGNYTIRAEKDGFLGSTYFYVSSDTGRKFGEAPLRFSETSVKVLLKGYRVPDFTPIQLSYAGSINGTVYDLLHKRASANVSLWQNGQMVKMPKNPQSSSPNGTYIFEHLAPGQYEVRAETGDASGNTHNSSTSVMVANATVAADVVIASIGMAPPVTWAPTPDATYAVTSIPVQSAMLNTSVNTPAPFPSMGIILIAMGMAAAFVYYINRLS